jgi:hypothetical protein
MGDESLINELVNYFVIHEEEMCMHMQSENSWQDPIKNV